MLTAFLFLILLLLCAYVGDLRDRPGEVCRGPIPLGDREEGAVTHLPGQIQRLGPEPLHAPQEPSLQGGIVTLTLQYELNHFLQFG